MLLEEAKKIFNISGIYTEDSIKKDYFRLAKIYHPDCKNGNTTMMQTINEAYDVLKKNLNYQKSNSYNRSTNNNTAYYHSYQEYKNNVLQFQQKILFYLSKENIKYSVAKAKYKNNYNYNFKYGMYVDFLIYITGTTIHDININGLNFELVKKKYYDNVEEYINKDINAFYNEIKDILDSINDVKFIKIIAEEIEKLKQFDDSFLYDNILNYFSNIKSRLYKKIFEELKIDLKNTITEYENYPDFNILKIEINNKYNNYCKYLDNLNIYEVDIEYKQMFLQAFKRDIFNLFNKHFSTKKVDNKKSIESQNFAGFEIAGCNDKGKIIIRRKFKRKN